ncbi:hypothetical protein EPO15_17100 [bacterium]|nr:MAG: hypothetical protein EPO15_17100 [bacterium]
MTPEEEGEHVGGGGFRVAGARALEVLRSAQLGEGFWRPLLWLRVAAALGARRCEVTARQSSLSFVFDGRPLSRTLLNEPLAVFDAARAPAEARWLAYALVHSAVPGAVVTITSGHGSDRRARRFDHQGQGTNLPAAAGADTDVLVDWPTVAPYGDGPWNWVLSGKAAAPLLAGAEAVPFELKTPSGPVTPWEKRKEPEAVVVRDGERRIRIVLGGGRRLGFHHLGVRVGGTPLDDLALPVSIDVDDPGLTLDASLGAVVEDHAYHRCVAAGRDAAVRHGLARLERHAKAMRLCANLLCARPGLRRHWKAALAAPERVDRRLPWVARALGALTGRRVPASDALRVARTAQFTAFLRDAATEHLRGRAFDARLPLGLALWETPLLFSATGRPLSLAELDLDERPAALWEKPAPAPAGIGAMMVWALSSEDAAFAAAFPRRKARMG